MAPEGFKNRFQQKVSRIIEHSIFVREVTGSWFGKRCGGSLIIALHYVTTSCMYVCMYVCVWH